MNPSGRSLDDRRLARPLAAATIATVDELGYRRASIEAILARATISRAEFDGAFDGKADLVCRVLAELAEDFRARVDAAYALAPTWPDDLRTAAYAAARWAGENPAATRFALLGAAQAGSCARAIGRETLHWCEGLVDRGRVLAADPDAVPRAAPIFAVGGLVETARLRAAHDLLGAVAGDVPAIMYMAVRPYLDERAARRELSIPPPEESPPVTP
jgi:AcrR family transcriptional regulator